MSITKYNAARFTLKDEPAIGPRDLAKLDGARVSLYVGQCSLRAEGILHEIPCDEHHKGLRWRMNFKTARSKDTYRRNVLDVTFTEQDIQHITFLENGDVWYMRVS